MNKTTKGALAASAAAVLLLGGAGTLAYWTDDASVNGGSINSGTLTIDSDGPCTAWEYDAGAASAGDPVVLFVPGDIVTSTCTFTVGATGDNLEASIAAETADFTANTTSLVLEPTTTFVVSGGTNNRTIVDGDTIDSRDGGATITATIDVEIPFGTDQSGTPRENANDTQGITAALSDISIALTQLDPNA